MRLKSSAAAPALCIAVFAVALAVNLLGSDLPGARDNPVLSAVVLQLLIYGLPAVFFCRLRPDTCTADNLRLRLVRPGAMLFTLFALGALLCGTAALRAGVYALLPSADMASGVSETAVSASFSSASPVPGSGIWYSVTAYALLPAITEEFLFRSVVMAEYRSAGIATSVLLSSAMFAMSHFSFPMFPVYFYSGLILALTVYVTNSVTASVVVHAANNTLTILFGGYLTRLGVREPNTVIFVLAAAGLTILFAALAFGEAERIFGRLAVLNAPPPLEAGLKRGGHPLLDALAAPSLILLAAFFIIVTLALG